MASSTNSGGSDSPVKGGGGGSVPSSAPWTQIVAGAGGAEAEKTGDAHNGSSDKAAVRSDEAVGEGSYGSGDANGGSKRPVWKKPSNGAIEVEPVMGADSWPTLSEVAKGPQKSGESSKSFSEASAPLLQHVDGKLQETRLAPSAQKQVSNNPHQNSSQNQAYPARQKSFKRHGGNASSNNGSPTQPLPSPTSGQPAPVSSNQNMTSSQKNLHLDSGLKVASLSQSHSTNDRQQHNNPHRRVNGPHQHGDSSYNHRYGARKDQERPNRDLNSHRSFNGRDVHPQGTGVLPRGIIRHNPMQHGSAPYIAPSLSPTMRPFGPPVSYPEFPYYYIPVQPEPIRGMSIPYPAPHQLFMQYLDPALYLKVVQQIDYYFSNENLIKDTFLRKNMDEQGWVPIKLIASFKRVMNLTDNIAYILEAIRTSTVVEVKDDKVRRRHDWMQWIMPESLRVPSQPTYSNPGSSSEFAARFQTVNINGESAGTQSTPPSGDPTSPHPSH